MKWFQFLRTGTFTDSKGKTVTITGKDLDDIVACYNPSDYSAALTLGHPQSQKEPAFGFVAALKRTGDILFFQPCKVIAEFAEAVNKGLFPRVSAGLEMVAEKWTLNHIAFLGAWKPAVSGLEMIEFAGADELCHIDLAGWRPETADFADNKDVINWVEGRFNTISRLLSNVREYIIEKDGIDTADKHLNVYDLEYIGSPAPDYVENPESSSSFSASPAGENDNPDYKALFESVQTEKTELASKLETATQRITELETAAGENILEKITAEFSRYIDDKIKDRRVYPAEKDFIVKTLISLAGPEHKTDTAEIQAYKGHIDRRPQHGLFNEQATEGNEQITFSAEQLAEHATVYVAEMAKKNKKKVSYADAVGYVKEHPEQFDK